MANYHILEENRRGDSSRVAFHVATPVGTNLAGRSYADCVQEWLLQQQGPGATQIPTEVPWLTDPTIGDPAEYNQMQTGEVTEWVRQIPYDANSNNAEKQAEMNAEWTRLNNSIPDRITKQMRFWGANENVT